MTETINVKGEAARTITLKFSRHGPIFHEDAAHHRAYALRSSLMEQGTAEYIGGLRMDQATSARDCLGNADFMRSPPTNLVCASADGALAFRVSAAAPKRRGFDGRLPVPGTGAFDWEGLRDDLPQELNPRADGSRRRTTTSTRRDSRIRCSSPAGRPIGATSGSPN